MSGDRIRIDGLAFDVRLGVTAAERRFAQRVEGRLDLALDATGARLRDDLRATVDYAELHGRLAAAATRAPCALLERLAQRLLEAATDTPGVLRAAVRLRKPGILAGATPEVRLRARPPTRVVVGLGANLGPARRTLARAVVALGALGDDLAVSPLYASEPWGVADQPPFLNAVAALRTRLPPRELLAHLQALERRLGRVPGPRWGPRAIDLDLLLDDGGATARPDLTVPHPRLFERAFVLAPLAALDAAYGPALARLAPAERATTRRVAEWPDWGANAAQA